MRSFGDRLANWHAVNFAANATLYLYVYCHRLWVTVTYTTHFSLVQRKLYLASQFARLFISLMNALRYEHGTEIYVLRTCEYDDAQDLIALGGEHTVEILLVVRVSYPTSSNKLNVLVRQTERSNHWRTSILALA